MSRHPCLGGRVWIRIGIDVHRPLLAREQADHGGCTVGEIPVAELLRGHQHAVVRCRVAGCFARGDGVVRQRFLELPGAVFVIASCQRCLGRCWQVGRRCLRDRLLV